MKNVRFERINHNSVEFNEATPPLTHLHHAPEKAVCDVHDDDLFRLAVLLNQLRHYPTRLKNRNGNCTQKHVETRPLHAAHAHHTTHTQPRMHSLSNACTAGQLVRSACHVHTHQSKGESEKRRLLTVVMQVSALSGQHGTAQLLVAAPGLGNVLGAGTGGAVFCVKDLPLQWEGV